jgi:dimethylaniline monooxygenase (N-oxide forming)
LIVGVGESGSDICNEVAQYADKVGMACRGKHGHVIPRKQADGRVTDLNTNRARYANPYLLGDWVGWANQHAKKFVAKWSPNKDPEESQILQQIGRLNLEQKTSAFSKFGCKNEGFVTAMVTKGAELFRDGFTLNEYGAVFESGKEFPCDVIIACTGYGNAMPIFLDPEFADEVFDPKSGMTYRQLASHCINPRNMFKQCIHPTCPDGTLAFSGFARPAFGSVPPCSEMQCRLIAMVVSGEIKLPSSEELACIAKKDTANWEYRFGYDAKRVKGLVDFMLYTDDLARQTGSLPPLMKIFLSKPKLWWKMMFSSFTMHQYRLQGPYANPAVAAAVYERMPVGDFLECSIAATFLLTAKILSMIGFKDMTPNHF